jgi:hypothetical protein
MNKTEELETLSTKSSVNQKATIKLVKQNDCFKHTLLFVKWPSGKRKDMMTLSLPPKFMVFLLSSPIEC